MAGEIAERLQRSMLGARGSRLQFTGSFQSRTAALLHFEVAGAGRCGFVVKIVGPGEAEALRDGFNDVADALIGMSGVSAIRPVALYSDLSAVVMPKVYGPTLAELVRRRAHLRDIEPLFARAGRMLARFHSRSARCARADRQTAVALFRDRMACHIDEPVAELIGSSVAPVPAYGDFFAHHIIVTASGELVLIDPPDTHRSVFWQRDIAFLTHRLASDQLLSWQLARIPRLLQELRRFRRALIDGYTLERGIVFDVREELILLGMELFLYHRSRGNRVPWRHWARLSVSSMAGYMVHSFLHTLTKRELRARLRQLEIARPC